MTVLSYHFLYCDDITNMKSWCESFKNVISCETLFIHLYQKQGGWSCASFCQWARLVDTRLFTVLMEPAGKLWWRSGHRGFHVGKATLPHPFTIRSRTEHKVTTSQFKCKYCHIWDSEWRWVNMDGVLTVGVCIRGILCVCLIGYRVYVCYAGI
jgi:hypothetical protein